MKRVFPKIVMCVSVLALAGCASIAETPSQLVKLEFKEPQDVKARCLIENQDFNQQVIVPGTFRIQNSEKPVTVSCLSANGREGRQIIEPIKSAAYKKNKWALNVPGTAYDFYNKSAFKYPDVITIDFEPSTANVVTTPPPQSYSEHIADELTKEQRAATNKALDAYPKGAYFSSTNPSDRFKYDPSSFSAQPVLKGDPALKKERVLKETDSRLAPSSANFGLEPLPVDELPEVLPVQGVSSDTKKIPSKSLNTSYRLNE